MSVYGVSLENLGEEPDIYFAVTIDTDYCSRIKNIDAFIQSLGSQFLNMNEETILVCPKGAFFQAEVVPDSWPTIPDPDFQLPAHVF